MLKHAMILAAGYGKRLRPLTLNKPKALVEVNRYTLLEICIKNLLKLEIENIIINVHYLGDHIREYLEKNKYFNINITLSEEKELLDTGGGIRNAVFFFKDCEHFLVHNVDVISEVDLKKMYRQHINRASLATLAVSKRSGTRYLLFDSNDRLCGRMLNSEEEPVQNLGANKIQKYAFSGIHILSREIFSLMPEKRNFSIIDMYLSVQEKQTISPFVHDSAHWFDVGKISDLEEIRAALKNKNLC